MIYTETIKKDLLGHKGEFITTQYFGKDVPEKFQKYIGKEYHSDTEDGVIIGLEDNESMFDIYFIIYDPKEGIVRFPLINYPSTIEGIDQTKE